MNYNLKNCNNNYYYNREIKIFVIFSLQVTDVSHRNSSSGTSGSASSPSSGVSSQLTGSHAGNTVGSQAALAAQLVGQQLLMHGSLGALSPQEIQALASTLQQQSLQQQLQQFAMFQQANPAAAAGQLPAQAQFFLQNQVRKLKSSIFLQGYIYRGEIFQAEVLEGVQFHYPPFRE